jgi:hypothetical protein
VQVYKWTASWEHSLKFGETQGNTSQATWKWRRTPSDSWLGPDGPHSRTAPACASVCCPLAYCHRGLSGMADIPAQRRRRRSASPAWQGAAVSRH